MFRKGKALGEMGFYEKAVKILEEVKEKNPSGAYISAVYAPSLMITSFFSDAAIVDAELSRLRVIDNERERVNKQKLKGTDIISNNEATSIGPYTRILKPTGKKRRRQWCKPSPKARPPQPQTPHEVSQ